MTKKNHSQELPSCITKLQSFYKVGLFVAVSTLCVPLYKAFPQLFGTFDIRDSITYIVYRVIRFSLYSASVAYKQRYPY